jgi:hypothetical protein
MGAVSTHVAHAPVAVAVTLAVQPDVASADAAGSVAGGVPLVARSVKVSELVREGDA